MGEILYKARLVFSVLMLIAFVALTVCFLFGIINISAVVVAFKADLARNLIITFAVLFGFKHVNECYSGSETGFQVMALLATRL